ncbi:MAG: DUF4330 domain-containing protein [Eubacteriales bacterium]|nr:DUF4330 domain-containing protein [Eubacteriales bacterium]
MLMDRKGKLFGKISIVDILIVLAIIVCLVGVYVRFIAQPAAVQIKTQSFSYTVYVRDIRIMTLEGLEQSVGTKFLLGEKGRSDDIGVLKSVEPSSHMEPIVKNDGTVVMANAPLKYDALLTFEVNGTVNDSGYYTTDYKSIGVGADLIMENKYICTTGKVTEIIDD